MKRLFILQMCVMLCALRIVSADATTPRDEERIRKAASAHVAAMPATDGAFAVASPFSSHMVLQRDCLVPVWGSGTPGETVTIELLAGIAGTPVAADSATVGANGRWVAFLPPRPADGPCELRAMGGSASGNAADTIAFKDVFFGDVWLCGGQSNMEMNMKSAMKDDEIAEACADVVNLRLLNVPNATTTEPRDSFKASWKVCTADTVRAFSACGFFFGRRLIRELGVPIGLVEVDYTGSVAETWLSLEGASAIPGLEVAVDVRRHVIAGGEDAGRARFAEMHAAWAKIMDPLGEAPAAKDFKEGDGWTDASMPYTFAKDYDGIVWLRRDFDLDAPRAAADAVLVLGMIDDADDAFVNGVKVGSTNEWSVVRRYKIPAGLLREGRNTVAVRMIDMRGGGGHSGKDANIPRLEFGDATPALSLAGAGWRCFAGPPLAEHREPKKPSFDRQFVVSACYNGMVFPLFPLAVRGAIWYQGCANVGRDGQYMTLLPAVIGEWRGGFTSHIADGAFPFYIVQLAPLWQTHDHAVESDWAAMRWAQTRIGMTQTNSGSVVTLDVGERNNIHPKDKRTPGERLAALALAQTYGRGGQALSPVPAEHAKYHQNAVDVAFVDQITGKPTVALAANADIKGFELAGKNGRFVRVGAATCDIPNIARLQVPDGMVPVRVRYAWDEYPICDLKTAEGLPVGPLEITVEAK